MLCMCSLFFCTITSCSKDDDPEGGNSDGSGSSSGVMVDGKKTQFPYAYWFSEGVGVFDSYMNIEFWSFDLNSGKLPKEYSFIAIYWKVAADQKELMTQTIAPGDYDVSAAFGISTSPQGWYGDTYDNTAYPLVIEKLDNNKFHVYVKEVTIAGEDENKGDYKTISIDYTGTFKKRPYVD